MNDLDYTIEDEIKDIKVQAPHVVILGAGASRAAFPNGDKFGKKLPVMADLVDLLDLSHLLKKCNIDFKNDNFEEIFSYLYENEKYKELVNEIEDRIYSYFFDLKLPDYPTIYDYLVLSLRKKDLIATFNWDPFLYLACWRNYRKANIPHVAYLHGNVAVGYCLDCNVKGYIRSQCNNCGKAYHPAKLLFPIKEKNYNKEPTIQAEWKNLSNYLENAYMITVFGYSAPKSDVAAVELMKKAWGDVGKRDLEQIEIIHRPGKNKEEVYKTWDSFIHTHHYQTCDNFYSSWISRHPRRTCDAMWNQMMECKFLSDNKVPERVTLEKLWDWFEPLIKEEKELKDSE